MELVTVLFYISAGYPREEGKRFQQRCMNVTLFSGDIFDPVRKVPRLGGADFQFPVHTVFSLLL